jgi:tetratricopeptide (TPR) repeat protein
MTARRRVDWVGPAAMVGLAAVLVAALAYGYPAVFPRIDAAHADHYERNVARALAEGDVARALKIARHATQSDRGRQHLNTAEDRAMSHTVYARALLEAGQPKAALGELARALTVPTEQFPPYRQSRRPYYFAPARLTLGAYFLEQDNLLNAAAHFELARAYTSPADAAYADFHRALYSAYARQGMWARALEYGKPSDAELDRLTDADLLRLARLCEGRRNWALAVRLGERLLTREGHTAVAHYLLGRAELAHGRHEAASAHLQEAASDGYPHAAFFLGLSRERADQPEQAVQAHLMTPATDFYRAFAFARAWMLLQGLSPDARTSVAAPVEGLEALLDRAISDLAQQTRPVVHDRYRRFTPLAVVAGSDAALPAAACFPVLLLWEDAQAPASPPSPIALADPNGDASLLLLRRGTRVLQLEWVENRVNWESVETLPAGAPAVPGWTDTAREWFRLRRGSVARIQRDAAGNASLSIDGLTWFYSVPVAPREEVGYLLVGRLDNWGNGDLILQGMNDSERVLFEGGASASQDVEPWAWQAGYVSSRFHWHELRVQLKVEPHATPVAFDDVALVEIQEHALEEFALGALR